MHTNEEGEEMNVEFPVELSGAKSSTLMWAQ